MQTSQIYGWKKIPQKYNFCIHISCRCRFVLLYVYYEIIHKVAYAKKAQKVHTEVQCEIQNPLARAQIVDQCPSVTDREASYLTDTPQSL